MKQSIDLPRFASLPAPTVGGIATLLPQLGYNYHSISIYLGNTTTNPTLKSAISRIVVKINGQEYQTYLSYADLVAQNQYYNAQFLDDFVTLYFDRPHLLNKADQEITAIYTGAPVNGADAPVKTGNAVVNFSIEITWDNTLAIAPSLYARGEVDNSINPPLILRRTNNVYSLSNATGLNQIQDIQKGEAIIAMFLRQSDSVVSEVRLFQNTQMVWKRSPAYNTVRQLAGYFRTPDTAQYVIDPAENGFGDEVIDTVTINGVPINSFIMEIDTLSAVASTQMPILFLSKVA